MIKYKWEGINSLPETEDQIEKNNATIALNISYIKEKEIRPA